MKKTFMKKNTAPAFFAIFCLFNLYAQNTIKGLVIDEVTGKPLEKVSARINSINIGSQTNDKGYFILQNIPNGNYSLLIDLKGYDAQIFDLELKDQTIDLGTILLFKKENFQPDKSLIVITDDELNLEEGFTDNIAGLLQSSRDIFLNAAAFDFSATFFRPRGLRSSRGKVLINGIEMNKLSNGSPQWANWGGMNDLLRNQSFTSGLNPNETTFGDLAGSNNITLRASEYRRGGRISFASANRNYQGRLMASYASGVTEKGWAYAFLISRRFGNSGYINGTFYDANTFFASLEKQLNDSQSILFNTIFAQNKRGRSTALTEEIFKLKGRKYNPLWGNLDGKRQNARIRRIAEPILMLNHYWKLTDKTSLNTNISYQFGLQGNTRIDNGGTRLVSFQDQISFIGGARNPAPDYYQNLPSFFLQDAKPSPFQYQQAFLAQQELIQNGQLNWKDLLLANQRQSNQDHSATYILQEDRMDSKQLSVNSILSSELTENIFLNAVIDYKGLKNESYAQVNDLLGGLGFLDIDFFAEENQNSDSDQVLANIAQSDLKNLNRIVKQGDRYKYNNVMYASVLSAFLQAEFTYKTLDYFLAANISSTSYQRDGLYENGHYPGPASFGKSEKISFLNYGVKAGITYKINGQHLIQMSSAYISKAPTIQNSFENPRQNNSLVNDVKSETSAMTDLSYVLRTPNITGKLSGYYINFQNMTDVNFFFTETLSSFVQEIVTNIQTVNVGLEIGMEVKMNPTLKLKGIAAIGEFTYKNNPNIYYTSDNFKNDLTFGDRTTKLKGFHVSGGPERVFQLGFEYRDPDFWWAGATINHFSRAFTNISNLKRSDAFAIDFDIISESELNSGGNISNYAINNYDPEIAQRLLHQEQFESYFLVNMIGGKSWKVNDYTVGFFASINNILNQQHKSGGFEQSRRVGYEHQINEQNNRNGPLFGNRYFFGNGTTYFLNLYIRF